MKSAPGPRPFGTTNDFVHLFLGHDTKAFVNFSLMGCWKPLYHNPRTFHILILVPGLSQQGDNLLIRQIIPVLVCLRHSKRGKSSDI